MMNDEKRMMTMIRHLLSHCHIICISYYCPSATKLSFEKVFSYNMFLLSSDSIYNNKNLLLSAYTMLKRICSYPSADTGAHPLITFN